ncbi:MAG: PD-(D/E)XK nuclease family protein [Candidatus Marsarchaeota archaeon]|nr:PD-(D/E)XK nuclease family protein [Candidatus Marsarchaeota archaeon]
MTAQSRAAVAQAEDLFGVISRELLGKVRWSYSRRSTLGQCTRRYYYEYFGSNRLVAKQEPLKELLHFLKGLQNRHERTGAIAHLVIAVYLRKAQGGEVWSVDRLVGWARDIFKADLNYSRAHPDGDIPPSGQYPPVLLQEYHYRYADAEQICLEAETRMTQALRNLATSDAFRAFLVAGSKAGALIERPFKLRSLPCLVEGKLDLAYQNEAGITVVDWKLGASDGTGDDSLQLAVYALWAMSQFSCNASGVRVCKVHLTSGEAVDFRVDDKVVAIARSRIVQDAERIAVLQGYGQEAIVDAFTPCLRPAVCRMCAFQRACHGERS